MDTTNFINNIELLLQEMRECKNEINQIKMNLRELANKGIDTCVDILNSIILTPDVMTHSRLYNVAARLLSLRIWLVDSLEEDTACSVENLRDSTIKIAESYK